MHDTVFTPNPSRLRRYPRASSVGQSLRNSSDSAPSRSARTRRSSRWIRPANKKCIPRHRMHSTTSSSGASITARQSIRSRVARGRALRVALRLEREPPRRFQALRRERARVSGLRPAPSPPIQRRRGRQRGRRRHPTDDAARDGSGERANRTAHSSRPRNRDEASRRRLATRSGGSPAPVPAPRRRGRRPAARQSPQPQVGECRLRGGVASANGSRGGGGAGAGGGGGGAARGPGRPVRAPGSEARRGRILGGRGSERVRLRRNRRRSGRRGRAGGRRSALPCFTLAQPRSLGEVRAGGVGGGRQRRPGDARRPGVRRRRGRRRSRARRRSARHQR